MELNGTIETVTLELLRQGPPSGQLLSASTPYLALCGNGPAETVFLPLDQRDFQRRLAALRYAAGATGEIDEAARIGALEDMARDMTRILDQVRALPGAIEGASAGVIHLRLVLSAKELAMLPFELANIPCALSGEGLPLCLGNGSKPVIITREARRIRPRPPAWPENPKILFAHASHADLVALAQKHRRALEDALRPWIQWAPDERRPAELARYLTVLPAASVRAIAEACDRHAYTHVHVLAHGTCHVEPHTGERRYSLALHRDDSPTQMAPVTGALLANALRAGGKVPAVVTLATCDGGNVGSLLVESDSVAHALHESGVSLVLASQLPLSTDGSVVMAEALYRELLSGTDPRRASHIARQALYRADPSTHDWASLVVYASLPVDPERELDRVSFVQRKVAVDSGLARLNRGGQPDGPDLDAFRAAVHALEAQGKSGDPGRALDVDKLLASAAVRWCDPDWPDPRAPARASLPDPRAEPDKPGASDDPARRRAWRCPPARGRNGHGRFPPIVDSDERSSLERAIDHYERVFKQEPSFLWAGINVLVLRWYVERLGHPGDHVLFSPEQQAEWKGLWWLTDRQLRAGALARVEEADALAARIELRLLEELFPSGPEHPPPKPDVATKGMVLGDIERLLALVGPMGYDAFALRRQLLRYERWWARPNVCTEAWRAVASPEEHSGDDALARVRTLAREARAELDRRKVPIGWDVR